MTSEWRVRFVDFPAQFRALEHEMLGTIKEVLGGGDLIMRRQLADFEQNLASFVGTSHAVGVSNCTDGMRLTLEALGVRSGDEVITVSHTFVATIAAIRHAGGTPILVDIGDDHVMDPDAAAAAITSRTVGIIPVHLNGRLVDMTRVTALAQRHGLFVLEDSAQALGASFEGRNGGSWGVAGAFSFYPAKMLGAFGDAGGVTTSDAEIDLKLRLLRDHGRATKNELAGWGHNCRLDNLQAALLDVKLRHLPNWIERRRAIAGIYDKLLAGIEQVTTPPGPSGDGPYFDVYQNYVIEAEQRDDLADHLRNHGIETLISLPIPNHRQPALGLDRFSLPRTEQASARQVSLPLTTELTDEQVEYVAETVQNFYA